MSTEKTVREALETFEAIASTTKRTEKEAHLRDIKSNSVAKEMIVLALGPGQFYVKPPKLSDLKKSTAITDYTTAWTQFMKLTDALLSGKLVGNEARSAVADLLSKLHKLPLAQGWFHAVLEKKLRMGVDSTIQKVWPGLIIPFGVPKGIALIEQKSGKTVDRAKKMVTFPAGSQPKKDGFNISFRCNTRTGTGVAVSSDNMELPVLKPWADAIAHAIRHAVTLQKGYDVSENIIVDGEVEAHFDPEAKSDKAWNSGWGKAGALVKLGITKLGYDSSRITDEQYALIENDLRITLYDTYPEIAHVETVDIGYRKRYQTTCGIVSCVQNACSKTKPKGSRYALRKKCVSEIEQVVCKDWKALKGAHDAYVARGEEGSIIRLLDAPVLANSRWRGNFIKWKEHSKIDVVVLGVLEGTGSNEGRGGAFIGYIPHTKKYTKVTIPSIAAKDAVWKVRDRIAGYWLEVVQQKDAKTGNAATFPVLSRFRHDQPPMPLKKVQKIADNSKYKLKITKQMSGSEAAVVGKACNKTAK